MAGKRHYSTVTGGTTPLSEIRELAQQDVCNCRELVLNLMCVHIIGCCHLPSYVGLENMYEVHNMKPTNSPTQGQLNPRKKIMLKVAFRPLFSHSIYIFRGLGFDLYRKQTTRNRIQETESNQKLRQHPH